MDAFRLAALIDDIYRAGEDPSHWPVALAALARELRSPSMILHTQQIGQQEVWQIDAAVGVEPSAQRGYEDYYATRNPWTTKGRHLMRQGAVLIGQMACSDSDLAASEYYNDYLRPLDFYHSLAAIPWQGPNGVLVLSSLRSRKAGAFGEEAISLMRALSPHLIRAARLHGQLRRLSAERAALEHALDQMPVGVVLADGKGHVMFANRAATQMAARGDGFNIRRSGLAGLRSEDTATLRRSIATAGTKCEGTTLRLPRRSATPLHVLVVPLSASNTSVGIPDAAVGVFVTDPDAGPILMEERMRHLFGLTPAEARIGARIAAGHTLQEAADELRITHGTARWLVKQLLRKTGTHTQSQAVVKILSGLASLNTATTPT